MTVVDGVAIGGGPWSPPGGGPPRSVLLVDRDDRLAGAVAAGLRHLGYLVTRAATAAAVDHRGCDAVLIDPWPPDAGAADLCARLRRDTDAGIIVMTASADLRDRVVALRSGADDVISKPFQFAELCARLEAVLRRRREHRTGRLAVGGLRIDLAERQVTVAGAVVRLSTKEFDLLAILAATPGAAVRRQRLIAEVWHLARLGRSRTLDVHIATLRAKVREAVTLESVRGVGYRLQANGAGHNNTVD